MLVHLAAFSVPFELGKCFFSIGFEAMVVFCCQSAARLADVGGLRAKT